MKEAGQEALIWKQEAAYTVIEVAAGNRQKSVMIT